MAELTIKTETEEPHPLSDPDHALQGNLIKSEEVHIYSELPTEQPDVPAKKRKPLRSKKAPKVTLLHCCYLCIPVTQLDTKEALQGHLGDAHPDQDTYQCGHCEFFVHKKTVFNRHVARHDASVRPHECSICSMRFTDSSTMKQHQADLHNVQGGRAKRKRFRKTVDGKGDRGVKEVKPVRVVKESTFKCYLCKTEDVTMDSRDLINEHLFAKHPYQSTYHCEVCGYSVKLVSKFNQHLSRHDESKSPYKCTLCPLRFTTERYQKYHEVTIHKFGDTKTYDCTICGKKCPTNGMLMAHGRVHEIKAETIEDNCLSSELNDEENSASSSEPLTEYTKQQLSQRGKKLIPKCYLCNPALVFESKDQLRQHMRVHPPKPKYHCTECEDYSTISKLGFNHHLSFHDATVKPFKCSLCPHRFSSLRYKSFHEVTVHDKKEEILMEKEKRLSCSYCGKTFEFQSRRKKHELSKSCQKTAGKLILKCYLCSPAAACESRKSLQTHLKTNHPTQPSYACKVCSLISNKQLVFNDHLAKHDATLKPLKCSVCPRRFINPVHLQKHEAIKHGINNETPTYPCSVCGQKFTLESKLKLHEVAKGHGAQNLPKIPQPPKRTRSKKVKKEKAPEIESSCSTCGMKFTKECYKVYHESYVDCQINIEKKPKFFCHFCNPPAPLDSKDSLTDHLNRDHPIQTVYRCAECSYSTDRKYGFNSHLTQHDLEKRPHKCTLCPERFATQTEQTDHEMAAHWKESTIKTEFPDAEIKNEPLDPDLEKTFKCYLCDTNELLDSREALAEHLTMSAAHPQRDVYHCGECEFSVNVITLFNQHLAQHDGNVELAWKSEAN